MKTLKVEKYVLIAYEGASEKESTFTDEVNKFVKEGYVLLGKPGVHLWGEIMFFTQAMVLLEDVKEIVNEEDDEPMCVQELLEIKERQEKSV